jgi:hypothetical protein
MIASEIRPATCEVMLTCCAESWVKLTVSRVRPAQERASLFSIQLTVLVINLQRTENVVEGTVEVSGLALRRYGYHIKHSAIP